MNATQRFALSAVCLILAVTGCGASSDRTGSAPAATSSTPTTQSGASPPAATSNSGPTVPKELAFTAKTVSGESFDGASLAGRNTVLWFWAPWCTVCARSAPSVKSAASALPDVRFVGVAGLSSDSDAMGDFVGRHDVGDLTHVADTGGDVYTRFGVTQQHTFVLIGADGSVTRHPAYGKDVDLTALVRSTFG
ncbi:MAG: redoxin family protein [Knoellia sp.]